MWWLRCIRTCSATIWICDNVKASAVVPFYEPAARLCSSATFMCYAPERATLACDRQYDGLSFERSMAIPSSLTTRIGNFLVDVGGEIETVLQCEWERSMPIDTSVGQQSFSPTSWLESRFEGVRR